ncbi:MAG: hypothetical protein R3D43_05800 [Tepidamorphaceae bacterium]
MAFTQMIDRPNSGLPLAHAGALALVRPTISPPIEPGPAVATSDRIDVLLAQCGVMQRRCSNLTSASAWARAADSGYDPPKVECTLVATPDD